MNDAIRKILEAGICAPSGDNTQPWKFTIRENSIETWNVPEKDTSLYNFQQKAAIFSHGALVENMMIAARALGFNPTLYSFPDKGNINHIATIVLGEASFGKDILYQYIPKRATNRKPYKTARLSDEQKNILLQTIHGLNGELILKDDDESKKNLAQALSVNERIVFENKFLHTFFFDKIHRTLEQIKRAGGGFPIKTLELPPPLEFAFSLFKIWPVLQFFNILGLSKTIPGQTSKNYLASSMFGALIYPNNGKEDFFLGGRAMQRIWLEATRMNIHIQPLSGIIFLRQRLLASADERLSKNHKELINHSYNVLEKVFGNAGKTIVFLFRAGTGNPPSSRTPRLPIEHFIQ